MRRQLVGPETCFHGATQAGSSRHARNPGLDHAGDGGAFPAFGGNAGGLKTGSIDNHIVALHVGDDGSASPNQSHVRYTLKTVPRRHGVCLEIELPGYAFELYAKQGNTARVGFPDATVQERGSHRLTVCFETITALRILMGYLFQDSVDF